MKMIISKMPQPEQKNQEGKLIVQKDDNLPLNKKIYSAFKSLEKKD